MTCCSSTAVSAAERQFTEKRAEKDLAQYRAFGPGRTTRLLIARLVDVGPLRGDLLDVGSGVGSIAFELLELGMTSAVGIDLSSAHVAEASAEAVRRGRSGSVRFVHGDFVDRAGELAVASIVTLDRVVCCYPDYERLIDESVRHSTRCVALSYPRDAWYVRTWVAIQNLGRRIANNPFRTYVHSAAAMQQRIERAQFELRSRGSTRTWCADVYVKT